MSKDKLNKNPIEELRSRLGSLEAVGRVAGVSKWSVDRWLKDSAMPRTEWTGETFYHVALCSATGLAKSYLVPKTRVVNRQNKGKR